MLACTCGVACTFVPIGTATLREKSAAAASLASFWWLRLSHLEGRFATLGGLGKGAFLELDLYQAPGLTALHARFIYGNDAESNFS